MYDPISRHFRRAPQREICVFDERCVIYQLMCMQGDKDSERNRSHGSLNWNRGHDPAQEHFTFSHSWAFRFRKIMQWYLG